MSLQYSSAQRYLNRRYSIRSQFINGSERPFNVFFAEDLYTNEQVVIKQVNLARWGPFGQEAIQEKEGILRREEALLRRVWTDRFPKFPRVIETFFDESGQFSLVLSMISGQPLEKEVLYRPAPGPQHYDQMSVITFGLAMGHLLYYLHRLMPPIIHRDIKPGNIIHCLDGSCALIDFGNAREYGTYRPPTSRQSSGSDTYPGVGSPGYAPPEICMVPCRTTPASDLYSLGAVMYQMVTGYHSGNKPVEEQFSYPPPIPYITSGGISYDLALLIMELLAWKPERRPRSAAEVIQRLERMRASLPMHSG